MGLKENEDCYFKMIGDFNDGELELYINEKAERRHETAWGKEGNSSMFYKPKEGWNEDVIAFIKWNVTNQLPGIYVITLRYVEIMYDYRNSINPEANTFSILMDKFEEEAIKPTVNKYGIDNVFFYANYFNDNLKNKIENEYMESWGIRNLIDSKEEILDQRIEEKDIEFIIEYREYFNINEERMEKIKDIFEEKGIMENGKLKSPYNKDERYKKIMRNWGEIRYE